MIGRRDLFKLFSGAAGAAAVPALRKIEAKPGGMFVLEVEDRLSMHDIDRAQHQWAKVWAGMGADAPKLIIIDSGAKLSQVEVPGATT